MEIAQVALVGGHHSWTLVPCWAFPSTASGASCQQVGSGPVPLGALCWPFPVSLRLKPKAWNPQQAPRALLLWALPGRLLPVCQGSTLARPACLSKLGSGRGLSGHGSSQEVCISPADGGLRSNAFFSLADQPSLPASVGVYRTPRSALGVTSCRLTPEEGSARIACHVPGRAGCSLLARLLPALPAACPLRDEEAYTGGVAERAHLEDEGVPGDRSQGAHGLRGMDPSVSRSSSVWSSPLAARFPSGEEGRYKLSQ